MNETTKLLLTVLASALASTGFWQLLQAALNRKSTRNRMLLGLAHDRIMTLGMQYIERGWVTQSEYENLHKYLYAPYEKMGGNGSARHIMEQVNKLPLRQDEI